ncbi:MAG: LLM class flavin-dependent oxidoreductase [Chloroflexi bacterium]|nr:LLM class flavin-dependent oxidoreductase [Chloroflexota bacterium]
MHVGLVMECDYRMGVTQEEAFEEAFAMADTADEFGLDGVWLAERHFAAPRRPGDPMGAGIPSVVSVPLVMASAIAGRTKQVRIGTGVSVLPLCHPVRLAEEAATVDQVSHGRLEFGVGRSGFPRSYDGYGIPYAESRARFQETLDVILKAWAEERFSHEGEFFNFNELCVLPKPFQRPHPPIRIAATTRDTFPSVGASGHNVISGLRGFDVNEVAEHMEMYHQAREESGHEGPGEVFLRVPIYVAETDDEGISDPEESTMRSYRRLGGLFGTSAGAAGTTMSEERRERAERLANVTYEDLLKDRLAYGSPDTVVEKLVQLRDRVGLDGIIMEPNVGGGLTVEQVLNSVRLYAQEVAPRLRAAE